jgi:hypothetical protein
MPRNYALEGRIKEAARAAGALDTSLDDFVLDHQAYHFTSEAELPAWIEKCRTEKPHRFAIQSDHDAELCRAAFIAKNKTAESHLYRSVGPERYEELKAMYENGLPESEKKKLNGNADHSRNPWAAVEGNINPKTGRFTEDAIHRQFSCVRAMGPQKAAQVAASVSCKLGDLYAAGFKSKAA